MPVDAVHGFAVLWLQHQPEHRARESVTFEFDADKDGVFSYYCTEFCSASTWR
ncbi:MAG: hypothetical protein R2856_19155 [Caldilineaceae bacterium]